MIRCAVVASCVALLWPVLAVAARDPDWPCQQIKVSELSLASMWSGPAVDSNDASWKDDPAITDLVQKLTPRREPLDQTAQLIRNFAASAGDRKQDQLLQVLLGVYSVLSQERDSVLAGLSRFSIRQRELAAEIRRDHELLRAAQSGSAADPKALQQLPQKITWEVEVFQDRNQALKYACDVPNKIEQRLFALAKQIQHEME